MDRIGKANNIDFLSNIIKNGNSCVLLEQKNMNSMDTITLKNAMTTKGLATVMIGSSRA